MSYTEGRKIYNATKAALKGNDFGLRCLEKLVQYENYIPMAALEEHMSEIMGHTYVASGDEEDTPHYETDCIQRTSCIIDDYSQELEGLVFETCNDEQREKFSGFAEKHGLSIKYSPILPFSHIDIPSFNNKTEMADVESRGC